ncbi:DNA-directed RNA polymerase subunit delta [Thermoflavimicrobium daqui]|uniref:Probable DNA-directed RNA polymerase subunit delta n=1 Tax=Thermoflavimicrobium daqui TaxID=2137476 RepID=A0A364K3D9_9BACL|nr:DNA-directed RNA polymerase subunit delta [Thermoflavimicrobium daqui]RAL23349.1 DNA-directed RNA polymerase subunit delta [Thermoflavimicrobium daqui]
MSDNLAAEKIIETSMVDIAYDLLKEKGEPIQFLDMFSQISKIKGFTQEDINYYISQLYTDINIDGRFVCVGRSLWGLRSWYPTEQTTDSAVAAHIKDDEDLDEELYEDSDDYDLNLDELDPELVEFDEDSSYEDEDETDDEDGEEEEEDL